MQHSFYSALSHALKIKNVLMGAPNRSCAWTNHIGKKKCKKCIGIEYKGPYGKGFQRVSKYIEWISEYIHFGAIFSAKKHHTKSSY